MPPSLISGVNSEVGESETPARLPKHPQSKAREVIRVGGHPGGSLGPGPFQLPPHLQMFPNPCLFLCGP